MSAYLACVDWTTLHYTNPCAGTLWSAFCQVLSTAINLFVPYTSPVLHTINIFVPKNMRKCEIRRHKQWRKLRSSPNDIALQIKYHENTLEWRHSKCYSPVEENIITANNLGAFYRFINKCMANRWNISNIGPIINASGQTLMDSTAKANAFNAYFSSVRQSADNGIIPECKSPVLQSVLDSIVVVEPDESWSISRLKINSSSGPDNIPRLLFVKLKYCLCYPLT